MLSEKYFLYISKTFPFSLLQHYRCKKVYYSQLYFIFYKDVGTSLHPVSNIFEHEQYEKSNEDFKVSILFWHNFQALNKLITFLCYCFMFKDQILSFESSHIPTLISVASIISYFYFLSHISKYIEIIFEMQIFTAHEVNVKTDAPKMTEKDPW